MISPNSTKSGTTHVLSCYGATRGSRTLSHTEMGMAMPVLMPSAVGESITVNNGSSDLSRSFSMSSSGDTNSNIMFFMPGSKKAKVLIDSDDGMVTSLSKIESQFGMSTTSLDMSGMDDYLQLQQYFIAYTVCTKRGCATHPRSIAERIRKKSKE
ncbi:unnamed protein product [Triticum turgidum subsp. durum]|uniref:Uncharacterized protein n=1 Tax=Triticum turgidum subsp. durum TaxID=4567 RepID=A0A9R1A3C8_TRITD|nr:unnamed protein product [Triticum turgidum subsp. durum]